ncbi:phosphoenolpyruvate synthase [Mycolicibacterium cosmeticum]|uniref:Rifampicin phosphotransferase n=1 Tax=Mycolicibacterium cosmeticum TaxID=258533 RepID=W9ASF7_MYCCO|nr:phosphoenolpyruvate synthase [Mycolicibacterium cosmeticum]TLH65499.1 phosphoenolpyruvate synthase [Mycolicibacterium cosmeticum]CDO08453.1 pyruvate, water dikinase [Mycolicibacterium cosmeticum]
MVPAYSLNLDTVDLGAQALVGGKAARLGELARNGFAVPPGFCVTVQAFDRFVTAVPSHAALLERLSGLDADDHDAIGALSAQLRATLESAAMPADIEAAIRGAVTRLGAERPCAVRSSATAEDLATASFAGQQDSYLDVVGHREIVDHVKRCWASLFTDRAIGYRLRNRFDHRDIRMAVLVQLMVPAQAAGVLFTADPVSGNRRVATVEAVSGLGDALVSGRADADLYRVRDATVETATLAAGRPVLTDADVLGLVRLGRRIEAHFGHPQDIEWCLLDGDFHIVQSRPITTLFPVPEVDDERTHVFVSVGHQQMMTDAMAPLGLSVWQLTTRRPMAEAGGRLFVDVTDALQVLGSRAALVEGFLRSDPLTGAALQSIAERLGVVGAQPDQSGAPGVTEPPTVPDPATVTRLIERSRAGLVALERDIEPLSGPALVEFIMADFAELQRILFTPESAQVIMAGMDAAHWLNDHLRDWLGETNPADILTQSVPYNVTSEMGLALLDVADAMRPHPDVVALLAGWRDTDGDVLAGLGDVPGGRQARHALQDFLGRYGMRCTGEIDITRPRWSEQPSALVPTVLANIANFAPGEAQRRLETGRRQAEAKKRELLARLRALPDGTAKAAETESMIDRLRAFTGYREYPKYGMVCRYFVYKRALLGEAQRLVGAGVLRAPDDAYYLRLQELHEVCRTHRVDERLIEERKAALRSYQRLRPPRVLTSEGEVVIGAYQRSGLPSGALPGLAVSAGTVEGRARVVTDFASARLAAGDILVTAYTDPSWTPLFVGIGGLVTEVGGLMTHGAVIAREYGLPAVVGVEGATTRIRDGQRIRVAGTEGYVEVLA